ncbi:MAG: hypothetical protein H6712_34235, partial [Myxococcales bacterium]|nr:hypothetical protein [Myxococcales bacterium]
MSYLTRLSLVLLGSACIPAGSETETSSESGATTSGSTGPATTTMVPVCEGEGDWHAPSDGSGDGGDSSSGDSPVGMGDDMPLAASVPEIQQGTIAIDTLVLLEGVVVTTPRATREGGEPGEQLVFVQDPAGGPWSGLRVHLLSPDPSPMTTVGDAVDLEGIVVERDGYYAVEVEDESEGLVRLGPGVIPPPVVVPVGDLRVDDPDGRAYEGIAVRVEQVRVTDDDPCDGEFVIEDIARVDDRFAP